ncbi:DUF4145 domain-containing protein [Bacillus sp. P14.5]|uniref:DUF4145 domain-containing protein n=1 Tax=Bacillus sp. P14.5 TaxID=1983400 RepID=UPI001F05E5C0|nr:DUF4145 domain-containing protein [Bacillus sp. P14.5]
MKSQVRKNIYLHSSDCEIFKGEDGDDTDLFFSIDGKGKGRWGIRKEKGYKDGKVLIMKKQDYYYQFLAQISTDLAVLARDLEYSVFTSPRMMLTHARAFVEEIINRIIRTEGITDMERSGLNERIYLLKTQGLLTKDVMDAVHNIRKLGNDAAHNTKAFRFSEALSSWESLYELVKWYMEVYGQVTFEMPAYQEPSIDNANKYDVQELDMRLSQWQESVLKKVSKIAERLDNNVSVLDQQFTEEKVITPGNTEIRIIEYKGERVSIPYFLRDAFLLPQRFENSERFMIALGGEQQARIISELPQNLEGISSLVKRYKEENEALLFKDLKIFIDVERKRIKIMQERPGELFLFFRSEFVIMTEDLSRSILSEEYFKGFPNFLRQLQHDGIKTVGQLPQELLILAKYERVGIGPVEKLFKQIKELQKEYQKSNLVTL